MLRQMNIATRMTVLMLLGVAGVVAAVTVPGYFRVQRMLLQEVEQKTRHQAAATAHDLEVFTSSVEKVVEELAVLLRVGASRRDLTVPEIRDLLERTLLRHEELYGSAAALTPSFAGTGGSQMTIPYVYRTPDGLGYKDLAGGDYDFQEHEWYQLPRELQIPVWSEPYYDEGGGDSLMVTYSVPLLVGPGNEFAGVVTGDVSLDWLTNEVKTLEIRDGGNAILISRRGTFVVAPPQRADWIMRESIFSIAQERNDPKLRRIGEKMVAGENSFEPAPGPAGREPYWIAYAPLRGPGWSLGILLPQAKVFARLHDLRRETLILGSVGLAALVVVVLLIARSISKPVKKLEGAARVLAAGDLDAALPAAHGADEVARLTRSFGQMQQDLKEHIEQLKQTTAARARLERDLQIARELQMSLVPQEFTFDPPHPEFEVHASMLPAREVGGDFYDFFFCEEGKLFLAVGDASGKGIPAALFMAVARTYLRAFVKEGIDLAEALRRLDKILATENDSTMFITIFCALLDLQSGSFTYANGGHNPPFVLRSSGEVEVLPLARGSLLGLDMEASFETAAAAVGQGDVLFTYSDGLVEAENAGGQFYEDERALAALGRLAGRSARDVVLAVQEDVGRFVAGAPPSDDMTMLAVRFLG